MEIVWNERAFDELTLAELYAILALRARVFVIEQKCLYLDPDGLDAGARHLWAAQGSAIVAYLRIVPAGAKYAELCLSRVITAQEVRRTGIGRELMRRALASAGDVPIRIGAQLYLEAFYESFGFRRASEPYDEDNIPHIEMVRASGT